MLGGDEMDKEKVLFELREMSADPFLAEVAMIIHGRIENNRPLGKILIGLLEKSERGEFK